MKTRIVVVSLMLAGLAGWAGACTPQPPLPCPVQTSNPYFGLPPFAVFYKLKSGAGVCAQKEYEQFGFQKYNEPGTSETHLGARPGNLGQYHEDGRVDSTDPDGKKVNAIGDLPEAPGSDLFCSVSFADEHAVNAEQDFDAIPDTMLDDGGIEPGSPALSIKYEWTNLKFIASPAVPGSAFVGDLTYTEDGCEATYSAEGFWPEVVCDPTQTLADGTIDLPDGGMMEDIDCGQQADIPNNHSLGSGINPDFKVVCDPDGRGTGLPVCVLGTRDRGSRAITHLSVNDLTKL